MVRGTPEVDLDTVGVLVTLSLAREPAITRTWTWREFMTGQCPEWFYTTDVPRWWQNAEVNFHRDPVYLHCSANIVAGREDDARRMLEP